MTVRFNTPRAAAFDINGNPRAGAKLYFYETTTLTPKDVYSDPALTTPILQPVTASSAGLFQSIYMQPDTYRVILKDSSGVTLWDEDYVDPGLGAGFGLESVVGVEQGGTGASNAAAARANLGAASSESLSLAQDTLTAQQTLIDTGLALSGDRFGTLASKDTVSRSELAVGFGLVCVQRVVHETVVSSSITSTTPAYDSSVPQISEGNQVFTRSFTPVSALSTVRVFVELTGDGDDNIITYALFKNSTANAVAANAFKIFSDNDPGQGILHFEEASGSTAARTYSVRAGVTHDTFTVNGSTGSLGTVRKSRMIIEEWVSF